MRVLSAPVRRISPWNRNLRVYRDDDLVIGILSNRRNEHNPATLATTIGGIALSD